MGIRPIRSRRRYWAASKRPSTKLSRSTTSIVADASSVSNRKLTCGNSRGVVPSPPAQSRFARPRAPAREICSIFAAKPRRSDPNWLISRAPSVTGKRALKNAGWEAGATTPQKPPAPPARRRCARSRRGCRCGAGGAPPRTTADQRRRRRSSEFRPRSACGRRCR